ncbi:hypothetical protein BOX15_Mlig019347g2 [Macrostomum lignano]|uniref:Uncharacterized protein n=1 Tax=Macrostomum lignano TaxID=282301 RepID=A0A267ETX4_9PLAT|nr:hypothetical protein BOX15_Mlig019347g2 [Macrostomum lignano]
MATSVSDVSRADRLRMAAGQGQVGLVGELLRAGVPVEPDKDGRTPLHCAAAGGHAQICRLLLDAPPPPSASASSSRTPLAGLTDSGGLTALHLAARHGHLQVVQLLMLEGQTANQRSHRHGNSPLHEAAWHGFSRTVELLCGAGSDANAQNVAMATPLHLAVQNGHNQSTRALLYAGSDPNKLNTFGDTALHTAARYGHAGVARILLSAGPVTRVNSRNRNGDSALHVACALRRRKIIRMLLDSSADLQLRNRQNETAIDVASRKGFDDVLDMLYGGHRVPHRSHRRSQQHQQHQKPHQSPNLHHLPYQHHQPMEMGYNPPPTSGSFGSGSSGTDLLFMQQQQQQQQQQQHFQAMAAVSPLPHHSQGSLVPIQQQQILEQENQTPAEQQQQQQQQAKTKSKTKTKKSFSGFKFSLAGLFRKNGNKKSSVSSGETPSVGVGSDSNNSYFDRLAAPIVSQHHFSHVTRAGPSAIPSSCTCHLGIHACIEHGYREWHGAEAANGNSVAFNRQSLLYQSQLPPSQHRHHTQLPLPPPPPRLLMYRTRSDESLSMSGYKVKTQAEKTRMQLAMQSGLPGGGPQFGRRGPAVASMTPTSESISPTSPPSSGGGGRGVTTVPVDQAMAWRKANRADDNRQRPVDSPTSANGISILKAAASDSSSVVVTSAMANSESLGSQLHQQRQPDSQEGAAAAAAVAPVQQPPVDKDGTANSGSSQRFKADQSSEMSMEQKIYLDPKLRFL